MTALVLKTANIEGAVLTLAEGGTPTEQERFLQEAGETLQDIQYVETRSKLESLRLLCSVKEAFRLFSSEGKWKWNGQFKTWAHRYYSPNGEEAVDYYTLRRAMGVYKKYSTELGDLFPSEKYIRVRNDAGEYTGDWEEVDTLWQEIPFAKLQDAAEYIKRGEMTPEAWSALFDPFTGKRELRRELNEGRRLAQALEEGEDGTQVVLDPEPTAEPKKQKEDELRIWESEGLLYATQGGATTAFARMLDEEADSLLAQEAASYVLRNVGVERDTPIPAYIPEEWVPVAQATSEGVVLAKGPVRILIDNTEDMVYIIQVLNEALEKGRQAPLPGAVSNEFIF